MSPNNERKHASTQARKHASTQARPLSAAKYTILLPLKFLMRQLKFLKDIFIHILNTKCRYTFHDRRKHSHSLIIILAGYKPFLWGDVLERVERFAPTDTDICIASSGKYDHTLAETAKQNSWSYLSIRRNCVELALNVAILLHPEAEFIYKIDEDIFVTQHSFDILMLTYQKVLHDGLY